MKLNKMEFKMATNSTVSVMFVNGCMKTIYCHNDGYPEGLGKVLLKNYTTLEQVGELLREGDASGISSTVEDSFFYGRDRGEKNVHARNYVSYDDFCEDEELLEYNYIFDQMGERWYVFKNQNYGSGEYLEDVLDNS